MSDESIMIGKISNKTGIVYTIELDRDFFVVGDSYRINMTKEKRTINALLEDISNKELKFHTAETDNNEEQLLTIDIDKILSGEYRLIKLGEQEIGFSMAMI